MTKKQMRSSRARMANRWRKRPSRGGHIGYDLPMSPIGGGGPTTLPTISKGSSGLLGVMSRFLGRAFGGRGK